MFFDLYPNRLIVKELHQSQTMDHDHFDSYWSHGIGGLDRDFCYLDFFQYEACHVCPREAKDISPHFLKTVWGASKISSFFEMGFHWFSGSVVDIVRKKWRWQHIWGQRRGSQNCCAFLPDIYFCFWEFDKHRWVSELFLRILIFCSDC